MPKEKIKVETHDNKVYYDTVSILIIALMLIIITKLGKIGLGLNIFVKIIFGDWYWLLLVVCIFLGFRYLFKKKGLDFKNIRLNGFFILLLSLMLLSHSTMYKYCGNFHQNELVGCFNLYMNYIKSPSNKYMVGGGLIGALLYQVFVYLIGEIGTLFISILILIMGIVFLTGNTVFSLKSSIKKTFVALRYSYQGVINYISNIKAPKNIIKRGIHMLSDIELGTNHTIQAKISKDNFLVIKKILENNKFEVSLIGIEIGYAVSRYIFKISNNPPKEEVFETLNNFDSPVCFYYNNEVYYLEINNKFKELLTLKRLLLLDNMNIPLGLEVGGSIIKFDFEYDKHLLISGGYDSGIRNFTRSFLVSLRLRRIFHKLVIIDTKEEFYELKGNEKLFTSYVNNINNVEKVFSQLNTEIEKRLELSNYFSSNSYSDLNNKISQSNQNIDRLERIIVIVNGYELLYKMNLAIEEKLHYLLGLGERCGIHFIIINRLGKVVSSLIRNACPTKILFKCFSLPQSMEIIDSDMGLNLQKNGDYILVHEYEYKRGQAPYVSFDEYKKIIGV